MTQVGQVECKQDQQNVNDMIIAHSSVTVAFQPIYIILWIWSAADPGYDLIRAVVHQYLKYS